MQDPEQKQTWEQEQCTLRACGCDNDCDCDRGCHRDCDCGYDHRRDRAADGVHCLPTDAHGTRPFVSAQCHASGKRRSTGGDCARGEVTWRRSWSRGQDPEQEPTREQEQGEGGAPATAAATATVTATVTTTATAAGDVATLVRRVRTLRSVSALGGVFRGYHLPFKPLRLSGIANHSRGHGLDHGCPRGSSVPEH